MTRFFSTALLGLSLLAGCTLPGDDTVPAGSCDNSADCPDGFRCMGNGTCKEIECTESTECGVEQYCNDAFSCVDGCSADSDCYAGDECDTTTKTCVTYGCRETELDCAYGEFCDTTTETCVSDGNDHCSETCTFFSANTGCRNGSACYPFTTQLCQNSGDCPSGQRCDDLYGDGSRYCHADYCVYSCNLADPAPRGYTCYDGIFVGDRNAYLIGDCPYIIANGG